MAKHSPQGSSLLPPSSPLQDARLTNSSSPTRPTERNTMNQSFKNAWIILACAALLFGQSGCQQLGGVFTSTKFDQTAYNTDKEIKDEALALVDRAKGRARYTSAADDVDQLMKKIDNAISAEQQRTKNAPTVEQWKKLKTQLSKHFDLWKTKGALSPVFVVDAKKQMGDLFDIIIKTEDAKRPRS